MSYMNQGAWLALDQGAWQSSSADVGAGTGKGLFRMGMALTLH